MKNIEKYTNTKDALEAYNNSVKNVPFDEWLELEYEEPREQTLLEAAEATINEWYYIHDDVTLNDLGEKIVDLKKAIDREKKNIVREKENPVRNCDKYRTAKDAFDGFNKMCADKHCDRCPFSAKRNECNICRLNWLYAEAEKSEAQNDLKTY